jgi:MipA family protein
MRRVFQALFIAAMACSAQAQTLADQPGLPLWEAGLVALAAQTPDYPGSRSQHLRGAVAPVFIYRGRVLKVDGDGIRGRLFNTERLELDLSGAAAFNSRQNPDRQGMPPLDYTFELGSQLRYRMPLANQQQLSAHLKLRAVASTNGRRVHGRGWVLVPELRWQYRPDFDPDSQLQVGVQATWADAALQRYFYQVDPAYQTPERPAYSAHGGYLGAALNLSWSRRMAQSTRLNASVEFNQHTGSANQNSPLLQHRTTAKAVLAVVWTPWQSAQLAN